MRVTRTGCLEQAAHCYGCDWEYANSKNGLAMAAQHHDRTGHEVRVEIVNIVYYGDRDEEEASQEEG